MAITLRASTTLAYGTRVNTAVTAPAGATTGDFIVVAIDVGGSTSTTITPPSGWTQIATGAFTATDPWWVDLTLWGRFYDGAGSWTWTHASRSSQAFCLAYIGVDPTTPIDVAATTAFKNGYTGDANPIAPSHTIATAGARGIIARGSWDGNAITGPSGWTERLDAPILWVGDRDWVAAGATGTVTVPSGNGGVSPWGVIMAALRPAGASIPSGSGTGTWTFTGTAAGKRTPKASGTGTFTYTGAATGKRVPKGSGSGSFAFTGLATGKRTPKGAGSGSFQFTGAAIGHTPAEGPAEGSGTGSFGWTGTAVGKRTPQASGVGTYGFTGTGQGKRTPKASGTGTYIFTGTAAGKRNPKGTGAGTFGWVGTATGADAVRDIVITATTQPTTGWTTATLSPLTLTVSPITSGWATDNPTLAASTAGPANESTLTTTPPAVTATVQPPTVAVTTTSPTT